MIPPELIDAFIPYQSNAPSSSMGADFRRMDTHRRYLLSAGLRFFRCAWPA